MSELHSLYIFLPLDTQDLCNPDKDILTFPNIPYWTGLNGARKSGRPGSFKRNTIINFVTKESGLKTPFIKVTLSELLWGYEDELPCLKMQDKKPKECDR